MPESVIYELPLDKWHDVGGSKLDFLSKVKALYGLGCIWCEYVGPMGTWTPKRISSTTPPTTPPISPTTPPPPPPETPPAAEL